jgi:hypothetical protein
VAANEQRNYDLIHQIGERASNTESQINFYKLARIFSAKRLSRDQIDNFRNERKNLNGENS